MLDPLIAVSTFQLVAADLEVYHPELTAGRRRFALNYIMRKVKAVDKEVFGVGIVPGKAHLGDYLKGFRFKVKRSTIQVVYCIG